MGFGASHPKAPRSFEWVRMGYAAGNASDNSSRLCLAPPLGPTVSVRAMTGVRRRPRASGDVRLVLLAIADSATDACIADNSRAEVRRRRPRARSPRQFLCYNNG